MMLHPSKNYKELYKIKKRANNLCRIKETAEKDVRKKFDAK